MKSFVSSMFFCNTAGSGEWYSQALPQAYERDAAVGELAGDFFRSVGREARLDAMLMAAAQLDALEARQPKVLDDRGQIPIGAPHVGDKTELHGGEALPDADAQVRCSWHLV